MACKRIVSVFLFAAAGPTGVEGQASTLFGKLPNKGRPGMPGNMPGGGRMQAGPPPSERQDDRLHAMAARRLAKDPQAKLPDKLPACEAFDQCMISDSASTCCSRVRGRDTHFCSMCLRIGCTARAEYCARGNKDEYCKACEKVEQHAKNHQAAALPPSTPKPKPSKQAGPPGRRTFHDDQIYGVAAKFQANGNQGKKTPDSLPHCAAFNQCMVSDSAGTCCSRPGLDLQLCGLCLNIGCANKKDFCAAGNTGDSYCQACAKVAEIAANPQAFSSKPSPKQQAPPKAPPGRPGVTQGYDAKKARMEAQRLFPLSGDKKDQGPQGWARAMKNAAAGHPGFPGHRFPFFGGKKPKEEV